MCRTVAIYCRRVRRRIAIRAVDYTRADEVFTGTGIVGSCYMDLETLSMVDGDLRMALTVVVDVTDTTFVDVSPATPQLHSNHTRADISRMLLLIMLDPEMPDWARCHIKCILISFIVVEMQHECVIPGEGRLE